jgi:hypothetical protein
MVIYFFDKQTEKTETRFLRWADGEESEQWLAIISFAIVCPTRYIESPEALQKTLDDEPLGMQHML